jgi:hypothetical protein
VCAHAQAFEHIMASMHMKALLSLPAVLAMLAAFARDLQVSQASYHHSPTHLIFGWLASQGVLFTCRLSGLMLV